MTSLDRVLDGLCKVRRSGNGWAACCPAHDDQDPSLSIWMDDDGRIGFKCHAGCSKREVVNALGLKMADLHPPRSDKHRGRGRQKSGRATEPPNAPDEGLTLAQYAAAKKLPVDFLRGLGVTDFPYLDVPAIKIPYGTPNGDPGPTRYRTALLKGPSGDRRFRWKSGSKTTLYGLDRVAEARPAGFVVLVEGESDCHTLWYHGVPALGLPGAGNWSDERDAPHLAPFEKIYVVVEPDRGGDAVLGWVAKSSIRDRVWLIRTLAAKDVSELHVDDPSRFLDCWEAAKDAAFPFVELERMEQQAAARTVLAETKGLLDDPKVWDRIGQVITGRGYAGDPSPVKTAYLAMTSRLLPKPVNLAFVAQSASGKNATVDAAAALIPEEDVFTLKAGSPRALIYTDASFERKVVIVSEADSIPDEGSAASAIRAIAEDNEMTYDVVEKDKVTNRQVVRHVVKKGPTVLITTSTTSVQHQLGTRMLEIGLPDTPDQTRAVLRAQANQSLQDQPPGPDASPFLATQRYFALSPVTKVHVPFAPVLAELVPPNNVRLRRDFKQLLTLVQASALLHQNHRDRLSEDCVVATIDDYRIVRDLLAPVFDAVLSDGVSPTVRETVAAVRSLVQRGPVNETQLREVLKIGKSSVSDRVKKAVAGGWLVNRETKPGRPASLVPGAPLPDEVSALPTVDQVLAFGRSALRQNEQAPLPLSFEHTPIDAEEPEDPFALEEDVDVLATDEDEWITLLASADGEDTDDEQSPTLAAAYPVNLDDLDF